MNNIIIKEVRIQNFKIYRDKTFKFSKKIALITGSNGFGKTTLVDAIEWCLTGSIRRVENIFNERNSTVTEKNRGENLKGIIKNDKCNRHDKVKVSIKLDINGDEVELYREQSEEILNSNSNLVFLSEIKDNNRLILEEYISNNTFYNYNVCDNYKGFEFLRRDRKEVLEMFKDFLNDRSNIENIVKNLDKVKCLIQHNIENRKLKLVSDIKVEEMKKAIEEIRKEIAYVSYPQKKIYEGEELDIDKLSLEGKTTQLKNLYKYGFNFSKQKLDELIVYVNLNNNIDTLKHIESILAKNEKEIKYCIENRCYDVSKIDSITKQIEVLKNIVGDTNKTTTIEDIEKIINENRSIFSNIDYEEHIKIIKKLKEEYSKQDKVILSLQNGNEVIEALSDIVKGRKGILKYKEEGNDICPLCGSEEKFKYFSNISDVAIFADKYIRETKSNISDLKYSNNEMIKIIKEELSSLKNKLLNKLNLVLDDKIKLKDEFRSIYTKYKDIFETLKLLNIEINSDLKENIELSLITKQHQIYDDKYILECIKNVQTLFELLNVKEKLDVNDINNLKYIKRKIEYKCDNSIVEIDFNSKLLIEKIIYLKSILNNEKIVEKQKELDNIINENSKINADITILEDRKSFIESKINSIRDTKKELEKIEIESVGPYMFEIFNKIIKHSTIKNIELKRDSARTGGIVLQDGNGNNLMNIFSQGQLGVLMLSYFFANMFRLRENSPLKSYFIDDITSCLDDINILSFIDTIKYILNMKDNIVNQIFICTCNDNLEKLIIHKMQSFNIEGENIKFTAFGEYQIGEF